MSTVLLPVTDHGRWTRAVAEEITNVEDSDNRAVVFYAFTEDEVQSTVDNLDVGDGQPDADILARRKEGVKDAVEILTDGGLEADVRGAVVDEEDGEEILAVADDIDANRIYLYSRKRSPVGKAVLGSFVQHVLLNSEVPVVVTPASAL
jgi:nucleotide-binding universal stress UspA family protein